MTASLRVGMNLMWLRPGEVGGSEVVAVGTVDALRALDEPGLSIQLYAQSSFSRAHPEIVERVPTRTIAVPGGSRGVRVLVETASLPPLVRRDRLDVLHCGGGVVPLGVRVPTLLTLHDVQPLEPGSVFSPLKRAWLNEMIPRSVRRADVVAVPSAFVRDRLVRLVDVDEDKIVVVPHGAPGVGSIDGDSAMTEDEVRRDFRLEGPYVLYPAITYPHKNHRVLVEALAVCAKDPDAPTLVLTGSAGEADAEIAELIERRGVAHLVRRVGRVTRAEVVALERHASLVAFPSRYEGFGLPVLEAFELDTPLAASSAASLPEVVGDAGVLLDPDDVDGWAEVMMAGSQGAFVSAEATRRRLEQAATFSWDRIVPSLVELYRRVAGVPS